MINEKRMAAFEKVYAELHGLSSGSLIAYRFKTEDSYRLPSLAHDYRMYCAALDSVVVELPQQSGVNLDWNQAIRYCHQAVEAAGVKVKV